MIRISSNIDAVIKQLRQYRDHLDEKRRRFMERLADLGVATADLKFRTADYDGEKDVSVTGPVWVDDKTLRVAASGSSVLFIEFGSGLIGGGHPQSAEFGYGPGTYSDNESLGGKHHWDDPKGWYYEHGKKSHGNPPARAMYEAGKQMRENIAKIAREVYGHD